MSSTHHHHTHDLTTWRGTVEYYYHKMIRPYKKMSARGKYAVWLLAAINALIIIAILYITPHRIGQFFHEMAVGLKDMGWKGALILMLCIIASSHPPLFGFSASLSMIGFTFGLWKGMFIGGTASLIGAALAWFSIRTFFLDWMRRFGASKNKQWEAFGHVMREKGWPLVAMIRWCPLPWAIGNGLFASIEGVEFTHFMIANALYVPRLAIPIFIGSRLGDMADDDGEGNDTLKVWLNVISIGVSGIVSVGTGMLIYRLTLEQMRKLDNGDTELAVAALEQSALLGDYTSDEDEVVEEELVPRRLSQHETV